MNFQKRALTANKQQMELLVSMKGRLDAGAEEESPGTASTDTNMVARKVHACGTVDDECTGR